jgi:hypothetical protein
MIRSRKIRNLLMAPLAYTLFLMGTSQAQIVCPGSYGGHLQGIATDKDGAIYWSFTTELVKTDMTGSILEKVSVPTHHGDLTFHDGKVYVAVNLGQFNEEAGHADSWVYVYDAKTLQLISTHNIPEAVHGAGGMDYLEEHFFVVGGLPKGHSANYVYEYDKDFQFLKQHTIDSGYTLMGIQTACYSQGYWWFGCYGDSPSLLKTNGSFRLLGKYGFDCALGISEFSENTFLIGRRIKGKQHRGEVLSAVVDRDQGLAIE